MSPEERKASEMQAVENEELKAYISEMLLLISTGVESVDMDNIEMVAENIYAKSVQI